MIKTPIEYIFNEYSKEITEQMCNGTNGMYPPHLLLEVFYTPAYACPQYAGWAVYQMGTRDFLSRGHATREKAIEAAIYMAKQMIPNGVVFERRGPADRPKEECGTTDGVID